MKYSAFGLGQNDPVAPYTRQKKVKVRHARYNELYFSSFYRPAENRYESHKYKSVTGQKSHFLIKK